MIVQTGARLRNTIRFFVALLAATLLPAAAQAAHWYYDNALGEVPAAEKITPGEPKPVQVLFEFQRDGEPNPKATKVVKPWAFEDIKGTGAFADVVEGPTADGAILSIKFNNIVKQEELDKAKKDGFGAGLGFGLFGGVFATDHYVATLEYIPHTGAEPVKVEIPHALYMTYGKQKKELVIPGTEVKNGDEAVKTVVRQALARGVNDILAKLAAPAGEPAVAQPAVEAGAEPAV
ncbi:MAG: hypothetical protein J7496_11235 [Novosphingobium sp.]|nr:hypothetical protein [Novosphingobium sp.]MBO9603065.1 hypothetical protein [Novosphingobium sp.]